MLASAWPNQVRCAPGGAVDTFLKVKFWGKLTPFLFLLCFLNIWAWDNACAHARIILYGGFYRILVHDAGMPSVTGKLAPQLWLAAGPKTGGTLLLALINDRGIEPTE